MKTSKYTIFFVVVFTLLASGMCLSVPGFVVAGDLSSNIMRRVNAANAYLDKAEEQVRTGKAEHAPRQVQGAQQQYDEIFSYFRGKFEPTDPIITALKQRIDSVGSQISGAKNSAASAQITSSTAMASTTNELSANIRRRIDEADRRLVSVNQSAQKGSRDINSLGRAKASYNSIFEYYKGSFDPNHPDIIALKERIDNAEKAMNDAYAAKMLSIPVEQDPSTVAGLPAHVGSDLMSVGHALRMFEDRLKTAKGSSNPASYIAGLKDDLNFAQEKFSGLNSTYSGQIDMKHAAYIQVQSRLASAEAAVIKLTGEASAAQQKSQAMDRQVDSAEEKRIMSQHQEIVLNSALAKENKGRIVWARQPISFNQQDQIKTQSEFKLTDPIFGRVYPIHSLGNTPVYSKSEGKPYPNRDFGYEYRLYIDGQKKVDRFDAFTSGNFKGEAGKTWSTWQFAPNPIPSDSSFSEEADAWRRVTKALASGTHQVRFEVWAVQGQFYSREPIATGEFSLIVGQGDRIAATGKFPADSYGGSDVDSVRESMFSAIIGPVAKSSAEVLKISVTSDWQVGTYTDSKKRYRKISGAVLWHDKDNDGTCRFTTYNFISDHAGGSSWSPLRYRSYCNGCPEGETACN